MTKTGGLRFGPPCMWTKYWHVRCHPRRCWWVWGDRRRQGCSSSELHQLASRGVHGLYTVPVDRPCLPVATATSKSCSGGANHWPPQSPTWRCTGSWRGAQTGAPAVLGTSACQSYTHKAVITIAIRLRYDYDVSRACFHSTRAKNKRQFFVVLVS